MLGIEGQALVLLLLLVVDIVVEVAAPAPAPVPAIAVVVVPDIAVVATVVADFADAINAIPFFDFENSANILRSACLLLSKSSRLTIASSVLIVLYNSPASFVSGSTTCSLALEAINSTKDFPMASSAPD